MAKLLGIITALLFVITLGKFIIRRIPTLNKMKKILKLFVVIHPYSATLLVIMGAIHGYLAYGKYFLFTGYFLLALIVFDLILGILLSRRINKKLVLFHRYISLLVIPVLLIHNLFKYII